MDTKALAKSKRAHSLHHSRKHQPHQAVKTPSSSSGAASGSKKPAVKQSREKLQQSHGSKMLPSNWDRYDEFDLGSEDTTGQSTSQSSEFVVPKSKGADYAYLISEANAQSQATSSLGTFSTLDDVLDDFTQDYGPLLSERGHSILSWIADDYFELEGKASTSIEVPFLSLNLNALAEQLAKVKLSERLFVDPEVIPPEVLDDESESCSQDKYNQAETSTSAAVTNSGASSLGCNNERSKSIELVSEHMPSVVSLTRSAAYPVSDQGLKPIEPNKILQSQETENYVLKPSAVTSPPIFEAENAEAELDMLLNSFGETMVLESSSSLSAGTPSGMVASANEIKSATVPRNIDDLLNETSAMTISDAGWQSHGLKKSQDDVLHASSKSELLDDFDSWLDTI